MKTQENFVTLAGTRVFDPQDSNLSQKNFTDAIKYTPEVRQEKYRMNFKTLLTLFIFIPFLSFAQVQKVCGLWETSMCTKEKDSIKCMFCGHESVYFFLFNDGELIYDNDSNIGKWYFKNNKLIFLLSKKKKKFEIIYSNNYYFIAKSRTYFYKYIKFCRIDSCRSYKK